MKNVVCFMVRVDDEICFVKARDEKSACKKFCKYYRDTCYEMGEYEVMPITKEGIAEIFRTDGDIFNIDLGFMNLGTNFNGPKDFMN